MTSRKPLFLMTSYQEMAKATCSASDFKATNTRKVTFPAIISSFRLTSEVLVQDCSSSENTAYGLEELFFSDFNGYQRRKMVQEFQEIMIIYYGKTTNETNMYKLYLQ